MKGDNMIKIHRANYLLLFCENLELVVQNELNFSKHDQILSECPPLLHLLLANKMKKETENHEV